MKHFTLVAISVLLIGMGIIHAQNAVPDLEIITGNNANRIQYVSITAISDLEGYVLRFSPDGHTVAAISSETLSIRDLQIDTELYQLPLATSTLTGLGSPSLYAVFSPDGQYLAIGMHDFQTHYISVLDLETREWVYINPTSQPSALVFSPDSQYLAAAGCHTMEIGECPDNSGGWLTIWEMASGAVHQSLRESDDIDSLAFSHDGQVLALGSCSSRVNNLVANRPEVCNGGAITLLEVTTGTIMLNMVGGDSMINSLAFNPAGTELAAGGCAEFTPTNNCTVGQLMLWNPISGELRNTITNHAGFIDLLNYSVDGDLLFSNSSDCLDLSSLTICQGGSLKIWDVTSMQILRTINQFPYRNASFQITGDQTRILWDDRFYIYELGVFPSGSDISRSGVIVVGQAELVPSEWLSPADTLPLYLIEILKSLEQVQFCVYTNGQQIVYFRPDITVTVTNLAVNQIVAERTFHGDGNVTCSDSIVVGSTRAGSVVETDLPADADISAWIATLSLNLE